MADMKIGYIAEYDKKLNPSHDKFEFREATFNRRISSKGDKVYSKMLMYPVDYEEIVKTTDMMKKNQRMIVVREPFLLDDEMREKAIRWVDWANHADASEYDPFCGAKMDEEKR